MPMSTKGVVIQVPGCTCGERSQEQLDHADVCDACVSYFDLEIVEEVLSKLIDPFASLAEALEEEAD